MRLDVEPRAQPETTRARYLFLDPFYVKPQAVHAQAPSTALLVLEKGNRSLRDRRPRSTRDHRTRRRGIGQNRTHMSVTGRLATGKGPDGMAWASARGSQSR